MSESKHNKKVALFVPSLNGGGAERVMVTLANEFTIAGFLVDLVLARAEGPYLNDVSEDVNIIDLDVSRTFFALFGLVRYLRKARPAVLLSTMTHANIIAVIAKIISIVPTRIILREANTLSLNLVKHKGLSAKVMPLLAKLFYPLSDMVITVCKAVAVDLEQTIGLPENKMAVIYNPVVTPSILEMADETLSHPWFAGGECPVVLGAGRLAHEKGFDTLIKAVSKVRDSVSVRLVILGEGNDREHLEGLVRDYGLENEISMPGYVLNPFSYMKSANVFVLSSRWEGLPNSLIQAMALGTNVISTDCPGGSNEILESGKWGTLVDVDDSDGLAIMILDALQNNASDGNSEVAEYCFSKFGSGSASQNYLDVMLGNKQDHVV